MRIKKINTERCVLLRVKSPQNTQICQFSNFSPLFESVKTWAIDCQLDEVHGVKISHVCASGMTLFSKLSMRHRQL